MTNEIRSPNVENSQLCGPRFRHSDFIIPSDFVIRHSDLRIAVCSMRRPVIGLARAAGGGLVHGKVRRGFAHLDLKAIWNWVRSKQTHCHYLALSAGVVSQKQL